MSPCGSSATFARPQRLVLLVVALGLTACTSHTSGNGSHVSITPTTPSSSTPAPTVSTTPPSLTPSETPSSSASSSPVQPQTNLVLTRTGWDPTTHTASAVAILPAKVIQSGTCTLTISQGAVTKKTSKASTPDASSTDCGLMTISGALAAGTWNGSVSFTGGGVNATSAPFTFEVTS